MSCSFHFKRSYTFLMILQARNYGVGPWDLGPCPFFKRLKVPLLEIFETVEYILVAKTSSQLLFHDALSVEIF